MLRLDDLEPEQLSVSRVASICWLQRWIDRTASAILASCHHGNVHAICDEPLLLIVAALRSSESPRGNLHAFLDELRSFESGIDPARVDFYTLNLDKPVMRYPEVERPGVVSRDPLSGLHRMRQRTIREYFADIGVGAIFDPSDPASLIRMQYQSMNPWGYVGYQLGEHILIENGYYEPEMRIVDWEGSKVDCPSYHRAVEDLSIWRCGNREELIWCEDEGCAVLVTDVNRWLGTFKGKDGVFTLKDLFDKNKQDKVVRTLITANLSKIVRAASGDVEQLAVWLARSWIGEPANSDPILCSVSGLAAACHLVGAEATISYLREGSIVQDELGTSITAYLEKFGGFDLESVTPPELRFAAAQ